MKTFERNLERYFDIEKKEEITKEALKSLRLDSKNMSDLIDNNFPFCKLKKF